MESLVPLYQRFDRLPTIVTRVIFTLLFLALLRLGIGVGHGGNLMLAARIEIICWFGLVWSTGFWYVLRGAFVALVWYLRIFH